MFKLLQQIIMGSVALTSRPNLFGTRDWFRGTQFFHGPRVGRGAGGVRGGVDLGMIQVHLLWTLLSILITSALPQIIRH